MALEAGDCRRARACIEESVAIFRVRAEPPRLILGVEMLAQVAAAEGNAAQAARLFGAFSALRRALPTSFWFSVTYKPESTVTAVRAALGAEAFASAWAEGEAMSLEQALACALEESRTQRDVIH